MAINYELLKTFLAAATAGSFRAAAKERFVTISAVSQQIKALEAQMGVVLFERLARRVALTREGQTLAAALRPAFSQIDDALEGAQQGRRTVAGLLRVGTPRTFGRYWVCPRLSELLKRYPDASLRLEFDVPSVLERRLSEGHLDVAILTRAAELPTIESTVVAVERFEAVAAPAYLKRWGTPATPEEFRQHRYGIFDPDLAMHAPWWRAWFGARAPLPGRIVAELASLDELLAMAMRGVCIAVLPSYLTEPHVRSGKLERLSPSGPRSARLLRGVSNAIYLGWRRGAVTSIRLTVLRDTLSAPAGDASATMMTES